MEAKRISKVVEIVQGSSEWLEWRKSGLGGSDAPVIEGLSPYKTKRELFFEKRGERVEDDDSKDFIFAKGHKTEALIRQEFCSLILAETGFQIEMAPVCLRHPEFEYIIVSLDGRDSKLGVLEAKLVGQEDLRNAREGHLPAHHYSQMQHQFWAAEEEVGQWFGHDGKKNGALVMVKRNEEYIKRYSDKAHQFWFDLRAGKVPAHGPRDYMEINDPLMQELRDAKILAENAEIAFKIIKDEVTKKYGKHPLLSSIGLKMWEVEREGSLNLLKVPEIEDLVNEAVKELDPKYVETFRGKGSKSWTVKPTV